MFPSIPGLGSLPPLLSLDQQRVLPALHRPQTHQRLQTLLATGIRSASVSTAVVCVMCLVFLLPSSVSCVRYCHVFRLLSSVLCIWYCQVFLLLSSVFGIGKYFYCRLLCHVLAIIKSKYFYCRILCHVLGIVKSKIFLLPSFVSCVWYCQVSSKYFLLPSSVLCVEYYQVKSKSKSTYFLLQSSVSSVEYCQVNQVQTNSTAVFCVMCLVLSSHSTYFLLPSSVSCIWYYQVIVFSTAVFYVMF